MAVAFQVSFSARFSGSTTGVPNEARQIAGSSSSVGRPPTKARCAITPAGASVPVTAAARRNVRRVGKRNMGYSRERGEEDVRERRTRQRSAATATGRRRRGGVVARHDGNISPIDAGVNEGENQSCRRRGKCVLRGGPTEASSDKTDSSLAGLRASRPAHVIV